MKIKGFIISGLVVLFLGVILLLFALTRDDFKLNEVIDDSSYEQEVLTFNNSFNKIVINSNVDDVQVKTHDKKNIEVVGKKGEKLYYTYNQYTDELHITQKVERIIFGISPTIEITKPLCVYIPKDTTISLNVEVDVGNVEINDINISNMYLDLDCGNLKINNCNISNLNCDLDLGNFETKDIIVSNITASLDCGNLDFDGKISNKGDFELDLGDLDLNLDGTNADYSVNNVGSGSAIIRYELDLGDFSIKYNG